MAAPKETSMEANAKAAVLNEILRRRAAREPIKVEEWLEFVAAQNDEMRTGPEIGEKVPGFSLTDQYGKTRALGDLMGQNGLLLIFSRSALW
jgi:hypothetical protein